MSTDWLKEAKKINRVCARRRQRTKDDRETILGKPAPVNWIVNCKKKKKRRAEKMSSEAWDRKVEMVYSIAYVRQLQVIVYRVCSFQWASLQSAFRMPIPRKVTLQPAIPMSKTKTEYECGKLYAPTWNLKTRGQFYDLCHW